MKILKYALAGVFVCLTIFVIVVFIPFPQIGFPERDDSSIVIENVHIVDLKNDAILKNQYLLIEGNRIKEIGSTPIRSENDRYKSVNGAGKYLIPALWDMHVHLTKRSPNSAYGKGLIFKAYLGDSGLGFALGKSF